jgi:DNA-binding MarR family transcriptional regulator
VGRVQRSEGAELAQLLLAGFRSLADEVTRELQVRGHPGVRPAHEFALRAIDAGADTASELGRRLSVSKQAAAQNLAVLERLGYVEREPDPSDARRKRLKVTPHGYDMMAVGGAVLDEVRERWLAELGPHLSAVEDFLRTVAPHHAELVSLDALEDPAP